MKRANGTGIIFKIKSGSRRKPWRVRITVGWELDELTGKSRKIVKTLGYYATRREAEMALNEYLEEPYNISDKDITFAELYKKWSDSYFPTLSGVSSERTITRAYRYMHSLHNMKVRDIRVRHLEDCLEDGYVMAGSPIHKAAFEMFFLQIPLSLNLTSLICSLYLLPVYSIISRKTRTSVLFGEKILKEYYNKVLIETYLKQTK